MYFKNNLVPDYLWISEIAHYNIPQDTLKTKTSKGPQWGEGQRSIIARDPHSRTVGVIPRGILDTS